MKPYDLCPYRHQRVWQQSLWERRDLWRPGQRLHVSLSKRLQRRSLPDRWYQLSCLLWQFLSSAIENVSFIPRSSKTVRLSPTSNETVNFIPTSNNTVNFIPTSITLCEFYPHLQWNCDLYPYNPLKLCEFHPHIQWIYVSWFPTSSELVWVLSLQTSTSVTAVLVRTEGPVKTRSTVTCVTVQAVTTEITASQVIPSSLSLVTVPFFFSTLLTLSFSFFFLIIF